MGVIWHLWNAILLRPILYEAATNCRTRAKQPATRSSPEIKFSGLHKPSPRTATK